MPTGFSHSLGREHQFAKRDSSRSGSRGPLPSRRRLNIHERSLPRRDRRRADGGRPKGSTANGIAAAQGAIIAALTAGDLLTSEAAA